MTARTALRALKAGSLAVADLPAEPRLELVDSAYSRAINVVHGDESLVCLHPAGIQLHPYSVTIGGDTAWAYPDLPFLGIRPGDRALVSSGSIEFEDRGLFILLGDAEVWDSRICPLGPGGTERACCMRDVLWHAALEGPVTSPFLGAMAEARGLEPAAVAGIDALMRERAEDLIQAMMRAHRSGSPGGLRGLLGQLVGFGPGLTPSGDDFLLGLVAAAHALGADDRDSIAFDVAGLIACGTSTMVRQSRYMFNAALRGHFPEPIIGLMAALGYGNSEGARRATRRLADLGFASGRDMLAGILFWLDTCPESAPSRAV